MFNKSVVIAGWRFVHNAGNQTGETTIKFMGLRSVHIVSKFMSSRSLKIFNGIVDLINAQTPPPSLSIRSRLANEYP